MDAQTMRGQSTGTTFTPIQILPDGPFNSTATRHKPFPVYKSKLCGTKVGKLKMKLKILKWNFLGGAAGLWKRAALYQEWRNNIPPGRSNPSDDDEQFIPSTYV